MTHAYILTGMTCAACEAKVKYLLEQLPEITDAEVSKETHTARISMNTHVSVQKMQEALGGPESKYQIREEKTPPAAEPEKISVSTYTPLLVLFGLITGVSLLGTLQQENGNYMDFMRWFMAGFFISFSYFKLINLRGFAESYAMYDIVAKRIPVWGYFYAFIELGLGIAYILNFNPLVTNSITCVVMSISIIGVLESVLNKKKIRCACLGAVFNLPMSTVTIIEDAVMIAMSGAMIFLYASGMA